MVTEEFRGIIEEDIKQCKDLYEKDDKVSQDLLFRTLLSKYQGIINRFEEGLYHSYSDSTGVKCQKNLNILCQKLELFKAMGYENKYLNDNSSVKIDNTNQNQITNAVNISFDSAKESVRGMSALKESEIQQALEKINQLEKIIASADRKTQKWEKAKDIIKWMTDRSVDVGLTLLPLLLKIQ